VFGVSQVRVYGIPGKDFNAALPPTPQQVYHYTTTPQKTVVGKSNYLPMGGYVATFDDYRGFFHYRSKNKLGSTGDGTSNTIMVMESPGGFMDFGGGNSGWLMSSWIAANGYSNFGTCPDRANAKPPLNCDFSGQGRGVAAHIPSSLHTGGMIATAFGDGSVRGLKPNLDFVLFVFLCGVNDGNVIALD
jgi:hypothetical protein